MGWLLKPCKSARSEKTCSKLYHLDHSYIWVPLCFVVGDFCFCCYGQQKDNNKSLQDNFMQFFFVEKYQQQQSKFEDSFSVVLAKNTRS